jgi:dCMP deaminase
MLAKEISTWSKDPSTQVGAVIVDDQKRVVSIGYNGFPRYIADDKRYHDREVKYQYIIHADMNALLNATAPVTGCKMYLWPFMACSRCTVHLIQAGISYIYYPTHLGDSPYAASAMRWAKDQTLAVDMCCEAGLLVFPLSHIWGKV